MKAPASIYKGIEFVSVQGLPSEQQFLLQGEHKIERINVLIDGKIIRNCIQYKHYVAWYNESFELPKQVKVAEPAQKIALPS